MKLLEIDLGVVVNLDAYGLIYKLEDDLIVFFPPVKSGLSFDDESDSSLPGGGSFRYKFDNEGERDLIWEKILKHSERIDV